MPEKGGNIDGKEFIKTVFKSMDVKPVILVLPNILLQKNAGLEVYALPLTEKRIQEGKIEIYLNEEEAKANSEGEHVYRVSIYRVE